MCIYNKKKNIFTFWEPKEKIPGYIKLCMKTWKKFLPDYQIIVLDYNNLEQWIGKDFYDKYLYKAFSLPKQADAIRAAVLQKHGGIWLDADTICTSNNARKIFEIKSDFIIFGQHIGLISAVEESYILKKWVKWIKIKIKLHKKDNNLLNHIFHYSYKRKFKSWDYLGNSILNRLIKNKNPEMFTSLDVSRLKLTPEKNYKEEKGLQLNTVQNYINFYFENDLSEYILKDNCGIICLHNSWTPDKYKKMTEKEFLKTNNTLSSILKKYAD